MPEKIIRLVPLWLMMMWAAALPSCHGDTMPQDVITQNEKFTVGASKVVEGKWVAEAVSGTRLTTNYVPPAADSVPSVIRVRLAINGRDNELRPGEYHYIDLAGDCGNTVITACEPGEKLTASQKAALPRELKLKIDLSPIKNSLSDKGYFVTPTRDTIYAQDYKGVWLTLHSSEFTVQSSQLIAADNLHSSEFTVQSSQFRVSDPRTPIPELRSPNSDELLVDAMPGEGDIHNVSISLTAPARQVSKEWRINQPRTGYPVYNSNQKLMDAMHNMSIDVISSEFTVQSSQLRVEREELRVEREELRGKSGELRVEREELRGKSGEWRGREPDPRSPIPDLRSPIHGLPGVLRHSAGSRLPGAEEVDADVKNDGQGQHYNQRRQHREL